LYQILRDKRKSNTTTNRHITKQHNITAKPMATSLRRNGSNGTKHIKIIEDTYIALPIPTLTCLTTKQGGYLPRKLQKQWKKELSTYYIIRKTIKLTIQDTNWRTHLLITNLQNHPHTIIPNPPNDLMLIKDWIKTLGTIGKTTKKNA
jgi:hypothetical protein